VAALRSNQRFLVTTHHRPDGDALGSALACYHALAAQGKRVEVVAGGAVPAHYAFLPGVAVVRPGASRAPFEVLLAVDCDGADRMAVGPQVAARAPLTISIDHHATAEPFGDLRYLDPSAAAAGELIYYLLGDLGAPITPEIATCLYCAIATDTGFFRFVNTTARALAVCAELVRAGADPAEIAVKAYEEKSINALALLGRALERARLHADGQIIATCLAPADFAATGASHADTEGIIDRLKFVRGVRVAALLREVRDNEVYVSLRSTDGTNVAVVAARFGGGGHAVAAGCIVPGPLDEAYRRVVSAVAERLNGTKGEGR
jgi:phosphoesterase RecJ-like protein